MADEVWFQRYLDIIEEYLAAGYDHNKLWELIGTDKAVLLDAPSTDDIANLGVWTNQIREAAVADINKPYTNLRMSNRRAELAGFLRDREDFVGTVWMACWNNGGTRSVDGTCVPSD